jgi:hypothetical protein
MASRDLLATVTGFGPHQSLRQDSIRTIHHPRNHHQWVVSLF